MTDALCLLTVHAHPDDEASKGAGTVAKYHAEGVRTVLVCCTGGEEGDILNPAMDTPEVRENLHEVRMEELRQAAEVIGYDEVVLLGYRDSGMPDSDANKHPEAFANAPLDEAASRLVAVIRRERPQVVVTYDEDQKFYPHPDHLRVHDVSLAAIEAAADPARCPEAGEAWQVQKLYYTLWARARMVATHEKFKELGLESPFDEKWFERPYNDDRITTQVPIGDFADARRQALQAQHQEHAVLFQATTEKLGGDAFEAPNPVLAGALQPRVDGLGSERDVVALALDLEKTAAATYQSSVGTFSEQGLDQAIMSVGSVEARHVAVLAGVLGQATPARAFQTLEGAIAPGTGV